MTEPKRNRAKLRQPIAEDFVATVNVQMPVERDHGAQLYYVWDEKNSLSVGIGSDCCSSGLYFNKNLNGQANTIEFGGSLGTRALGHHTFYSEPVPWYFQIEKRGRKYTARASVDGSEWTDIGTHTVLQMKDARLGFLAGSGGGIEHEAAFDDFVVKRLK
ncbi:MAG: hypothetical protein WA970_05120 [Gammaproteobacteria bacterium]